MHVELNIVNILIHRSLAIQVLLNMWCMFTRVCMCVFTYVCMCVHARVHACVQACVQVCVYMCVCMHLCTGVYMYMWIKKQTIYSTEESF